MTSGQRLVEVAKVESGFPFFAGCLPAGLLGGVGPGDCLASEGRMVPAGSTAHPWGGELWLLGFGVVSWRLL